MSRLGSARAAVRGADGLLCPPGAPQLTGKLRDEPAVARVQAVRHQRALIGVGRAAAEATLVVTQLGSCHVACKIEERGQTLGFEDPTMDPCSCGGPPTARNPLQVSEVVHRELQNVRFLQLALSDLRGGNK